MALERRAWLALCLVFALALGVRVAFKLGVQGSALDAWHTYDQSDMATYLAQSEQFASGDWLAREPVHPYHGWQSVAPPEKWLEWYGPHAFHQAPGYSYLLAFAARAGLEPVATAKWLQLFVGALTAVFAALFARELFGLAAGVVAGLLVALYGPLYYLEAQILREGPALCALFALAWLLVRELRAWREHGHRREHGLEATGRPRWLAVGALGAGIGLFHVFHEMGTVVFVAFAVVLASATWRSGARPLVATLGALLGGYLVGFAPLLARNLAVGAAPFSVSCRTLVNFAEANEANAAEGGATFVAPGPTVVKLLDDAGGSFPRLLVGVWNTYDGDVGKLVGNWWLRFSAVWKHFEEADNTSFYFFREYVPVLSASPTFVCLFPLGVAGLALALVSAGVGALARRRGSSGPWPELLGLHPRGQFAAFVLLAFVALALSFVHTVARFRLYATPALFVFAAFALVAAWQSLRARRLGSLAALALVAVLASFGQHALTRETAAERFRPVDWFVAAKTAAAAGDLERALAFMDDSARRYTGDTYVYAAVGREREDAKDFSAAARCYERGFAVLQDVARTRRVPFESLAGAREVQAGLARVQSSAGGAR
ncbi:MAG: hypothetical protein L6Q99_22500 [Planctomycetes bacterium]|nr:hypothetical protein [Planctomycetota bacterium]